MNSARWELLTEIYSQAREAPIHERGALLDRLCSSAPEIRSEVEALLALKTSANMFNHPPIRLLQDGDLFDFLGESFGAYRVVREIGRGGMGVVYLAARADDEFERFVALKVIRPDLAQRDREQTFRTEIQALANLTHPGIAKLLDAGRTEDGRLYFLMEFVEGIPITEFCRAHSLPLSERLRLFLKVCAAVQHAHSRLVIHCDLKPANLLVQPDGDVRIVDFGIARLLSRGVDEQVNEQSPAPDNTSFFTHFYSSPEQRLGFPLGTATDVYSLGVVFSEVLHDGQPNSLEGTELPKDLCAIIARAQNPDPSDRYMSVAEFAQDVINFLDYRPVGANDSSLLHKFALLLRRHRIEALALLIIATVGITTLTTVLLQKQETEVERDKFEQISRLLVDLFEIADPSETRGRSVTSLEVLREGTKRLQSSLANQPEVQAALLARVGQIYLQLGLLDEADQAYQQSYTLMSNVLGKRHLDTINSLNCLGEVALSRGDYKVAEDRFREALVLREELLPHGHPWVVESANNLAWTLNVLERREEATSVLLQATDGNPEEVTNEPAVFNTFGQIYLDSGDPARAEHYFRLALSLRRQKLGTDHPRYARGLKNLASSLQAQGRSTEALKLFEQALELQRRLFGAESGEVAGSLGEVGSLYADLRDYQRAAPFLQEAASLRVRQSPEHSETAVALGNYAKALRKLGRTEESLAMHKKAFEIFLASLGATHSYVAYTRINIAEVHLDRGELVEAARELEAALQVLPFGGSDRNTGTLFRSLARLRDLQGQLPEAIELSQKAVSELSRFLPPEHFRRAEAECQLGLYLYRSGRLKEAAEILSSAIPRVSATGIPSSLLDEAAQVLKAAGK